MAILSCRGSTQALRPAELQAAQRMQLLWARAEQSGAAAAEEALWHGEASAEYQAALQRWAAELQYLDLFIGALDAASRPALGSALVA
jgi:uncharacterized protein YukE|eukprot:COSAG06_NODE_13815_length_1212_cov_1.642793_2_plen_88_part_00